MNRICDVKEREEALDIGASFIVEAPAGSGKTELLVRRFLKLLGCACRFPEEILAITFTRKAAFEMRDRIVRALFKAAHEKMPEDAYAKETFLLARTVIEQDKAFNWGLLDNANRLRIMTFDALCARLAVQLPLESGFSAEPRITQDPQALYERAANNLLSQLDGDDAVFTQALCELLSHLDNRMDVAAFLIKRMLEKRDQWLPHVMACHSDEDLRTTLEAGLKAISQDTFERLFAAFPKGLFAEFKVLFNYSCEHRQLPSYELEINGEMTENGLEAFKKLSELFLTQKGSWRTRFTKAEGFPAKTAGKTPEEKALFDEMKSKVTAFIEACEAHDDLKEALFEVQSLPPLCYSDAKWAILKALLVLLPLAAAQLKLIFKEKGEVDYIEVASAALMAFGDLDAPSDLALKLDYRLSHLLIDEFQDTSLSQYRLTQCLITGFEPSDGRTLFIVGDPMQSIYRFRNAQVGLFLRTKREGLSHLLLKPLTLKANFRSSFPIVDWVNQVFSSIFPKFEDVSSGAVRYRSSVAQTNHEQTVCEQSDCISFYPFVEGDPEKESTCIAALVSSLLERSKDETVAVLVRARYHLVDIILAFRQANLSFQAVEIDKLNTRAVISDLVCLTQAILHLADRIAWLSVLRAPFCGLCLSDLHVIAGQNKKQTIWERLHDIDVFNALSEHGKKSVSLLRAVLDQAMKARGQKRLHRLIREAWLLLKGPSCVTQKSDLVDVNVFFELLRELDTGGDLLDFEVLQEKVDQLFANTDQEANPRLQVMTIHKAKGLEFDHVILPALERYSPKSDSELLMWMERPRTHEKSDLILAPIASKTTQEEDPVYRYCKDQDKLKERYEALRLLYVAVTRAKKQLYLLGTTAYGKEGRAKEPKKGSFLNMLWTFFEDRFASLQKEPEDQSFAESAVSLSVAKSSHFLSRLEHEVTFGKIAAFVEEPSFNVSDLALFDVTVNGLSWQAPVGTLVHRLLYEIGVSGIETWSQKRFLNSKAHFEKALRQLGVSHDDMRVALDRVCLAIENALTDQRGRWILERHRADGFEFEVVSKGNIGVRRYVIDRTFLDESSQRWIIDYKTSEVGAFSSIESFMSAEKEKYQSQLENYGKLISDCFKGEQVRFGLYFPLVPCFLEW